MPVEALVDTAGTGVDVSAEALAVVAACVEERTVEVVVICLQFRDAQDLTLARLRQHRHVVREALDGRALCVGRLRRQTGAFSRDGVGERHSTVTPCVWGAYGDRRGRSQETGSVRHSTVTPCVWGAYGDRRGHSQETGSVRHSTVTPCVWGAYGDRRGRSQETGSERGTRRSRPVCGAPTETDGGVLKRRGR